MRTRMHTQTHTHTHTQTHTPSWDGGGVNVLSPTEGKEHHLLILKAIQNSIHSPYQTPGSSMSHPLMISFLCVCTPVYVYSVCVCTCNALCPILTHSWVTRSDQDSSTTTHAYDVDGKYSHCSAELELRILDLWLGCITY